MGNSKLLGALAFGLASVMNPAFFTGCGSVLAPTFAFGEADVVALVGVARAQRYELKTADASYEIIVDLAQARGDDSRSGALEPSVVRPARACGNRTFLRSAAACLDETDVPVAGTITITRVSPDVSRVADKAEAKGKLTVYGSALTNAQLEISAGKYSVSLRSDDAKTFEVARVVIDGKTLEPAPNGG